MNKNASQLFDENGNGAKPHIKQTIKSNGIPCQCYTTIHHIKVHNKVLIKDIKVFIVLLYWSQIGGLREKFSVSAKGCVHSEYSETTVLLAVKFNNANLSHQFSISKSILSHSISYIWQRSVPMLITQRRLESSDCSDACVSRWGKEGISMFGMSCIISLRMLKKQWTGTVSNCDKSASQRDNQHDT